MMPTMKRHATPWVGEWLSAIRVSKNLQAKDIAGKLDIDPANVARRECGLQRIAADDLPIVLEAYGATLAQFVAEAKKRVPS